MNEERAASEETKKENERKKKSKKTNNSVKKNSKKIRRREYTGQRSKEKEKRMGRQGGRKASAIPAWRTVPLHQRVP